MGKFFFIIAFLLFLIGASFNAAVQAKEVARVVAAVNNQVITSKDVNDYCAAMAYRLESQDKEVSCSDPKVKREALDRLLEDRLVLAEAKSGEMEVPRGMIEERLNRIRLSYPSREAFDESLIERGLTITSLKEILKEKMLMQTIVEYNVKSFVIVSPQEISDFYQTNKDSFKTPQSYVFFIAESYDYDELKKITETIDAEGIKKAHRDFGALLFAVESTREELKRGLGDILSRLENSSYDIEKVDDHYYLIYRDYVNEPRILSLEEAKEQIDAHLKDIQFKQRFVEWLKQLKETAVIKYYDKS
jgi:SurA-like N-terminal domain/PPIC-type PPIASE domain